MCYEEFRLADLARLCDRVLHAINNNELYSQKIAAAKAELADCAGSTGPFGHRFDVRMPPVP